MLMPACEYRCACILLDMYMCEQCVCVCVCVGLCVCVCLCVCLCVCGCMCLYCICYVYVFAGVDCLPGCLSAAPCRRAVCPASRGFRGVCAVCLSVLPVL